MYIRYFAATTDDIVGRAARLYMRSMVQYAPVRLLSLTGILEGAWDTFTANLITPLVPPWINVVCVDPSRWTWLHQVAMPKHDANPVDAGDVPIEGIARERIELYTADVHNILFATVMPRSKAEMTTALRYESLVVASDEQAASWRTAPGCNPIVIHPSTEWRDSFVCELLAKVFPKDVP